MQQTSMLCDLKKVFKFKFFGSHTFSISVADVEVVAGRSTLPFTSYVFRVRDASRWGWAPLRLGGPAPSLSGYPWLDLPGVRDSH